MMIADVNSHISFDARGLAAAFLANDYEVSVELLFVFYFESILETKLIIFGRPS